jgi:serine/threonine-protein kinase RsbW
VISERVFDLRVEASLKNLHEIRTFIEQSGQRLGVQKSALADLQLAVDEAVTNIVLHGYGGHSGPVELHMEPSGENVIVRIRDQARWFDSSTVRAPQLDTNLADRPFGGMGLFLIKKMTDESEFRALPGGGNELELVKWGAVDPGQG